MSYIDTLRPTASLASSVSSSFPAAPSHPDRPVFFSSAGWQVRLFESVEIVLLLAIMSSISLVLCTILASAFEAN